jgi:HNH endonuclease/AP2 domain
MKPYPTKEEILNSLKYDPETGIFTKLHKRGRPTSGNLATGYCGSGGYIRIGLNGTHWPAHRLAWIVHTGKDTELQIDHINGIRNDNRISNLREACAVTQGRNKRLLCNNESGIMGVYMHPTNRRWVAQIGVEGKAIYLGSYRTLDEAKAARFAADRVIGFHENHGRHLVEPR